MTGHRRIPENINLVCSPHVSIEPTMQRRVLRRKENLIVLPYLWYDDMDVNTIEVFRNSQLEGTDQKTLFILIS